MSKWYCYDGSVSGPYYNTQQEARRACGPDEAPRPINNDVCPDVVDVAGSVVSDTEADSDDEATYSEWSHDDLKAEAADRGIADEVDLRSKDGVRKALEADDSAE